MLLMKLQCWCGILMWLLPDDVTTGAASWLLSLMWDAHSMGWKEWGDWLVLWSQLAVFIIVIDYPLPFIDYFISQFLWLIRWLTRSPVDESYSQQSSKLQLNSHVIDFDNFNDFPQSYWLISSQSYSFGYSHSDLLYSQILLLNGFISWLTADVGDLPSM